VKINSAEKETNPELFTLKNQNKEKREIAAKEFLIYHNEVAKEANTKKAQPRSIFASLTEYFNPEENSQIKCAAAKKDHVRYINIQAGCQLKACWHDRNDGLIRNSRFS